MVRAQALRPSAPGLPIAWQGWALTLGFVAIVIWLSVRFADRPVVLFAALAPFAIAFMVICARTTRGGWRWRVGRGRRMIGLIMAMAAAASIPVTASGPQGPLAGTFVDAGVHAPVVLIIPGSGPTDRDGNNPLGVTAAPYRLLAEALAAKGVSSVRIDKRGHVRKQGRGGRSEHGDDRRLCRRHASWVTAIRDRTERNASGCSGIAKAHSSHSRPPSSPTGSAASSLSRGRAASSATSSAQQLRDKPSQRTGARCGDERARRARGGKHCRRHGHASRRCKNCSRRRCRIS